jgi:hypothetical protein
MLSDLGFRSKQSTNQRWILWLDSSTRERSLQLVKTYGHTFRELRKGLHDMPRFRIPRRQRALR